MLSPDGDLVIHAPNHLAVRSLLLVGDQSSLFEDLVEEDVDNNIVPGVDLSRYLSAAAHDMSRIERQPCFAAPAL